MNTNFKIQDIEIDKLYVNPDNARFINAEEIPNELSAIRTLIFLKTEFTVDLAKDIASYGLNPNELPIVMYNSDVGCFLVMDGNRRITSIKIITQYIDKIDSMGFTPSQKRELLSLKCNIKSIQCIVYEDEEYVNYLLEKLHTFKPGISQVKWDPQAQDRHREKAGTISRRLAIIKLLSHSKFTSPEARNVLNEERWLSKLKRYMPKEYISFFGIEFDKDNNILLRLEESEIIKGLSQLVVDLEATKSDDIAQTKTVRKKYLENFPTDKKPDETKINNPLIVFDVNKEEFIQTNIANNMSLNNDNNNNKDSKSNKDNSTSTSGLEDSSSQKNNPTKEDISSKLGGQDPVNEPDKKNKNKEENGRKIRRSNPPFSTPNFFEDLSWNTVNTNNDNIGILRVAQEIVNISRNNNYKEFPISATFLTRSLFEQTLIYHLRTFSLSAYNNLLKSNNNRTPALEKLISYFVKNSSNIFANDKNLERTFLSFADSSGTKHYLDMVIHNPHLVAANPDILDNIVDAGLKAYIQTILNR